MPNYPLKLLLLLNAPWLQNPLLVNFIRAGADAKFIWTKGRTWLEFWHSARHCGQELHLGKNQIGAVILRGNFVKSSTDV